MFQRGIAYGVLFFLSISADAAIFGGDDRINVIPASRSYSLARATAVAVISSNVSTNAKGLLNLSPDFLSDALCSDEKFSKEPSLSYACTGFLVGPDLLVTAGHCMVNTGEDRHQSETYCEAYSWLFDYNVQANGQIKLTDIAPENLYACKEVIYAIREEREPFRDFALVRLKRATDRPVLKLARGSMRRGDPVSMIGYPLGMPAKISTHARVLMNDASKQSFVTNLDALDGNSGSPVFNSKNEVAGILVGGTPIELFRKDKAGCSRYNTCDALGKNCVVADKSRLPEFQRTGSIVQRIDTVSDFINQMDFKIFAKSLVSPSAGG